MRAGNFLPAIGHAASGSVGTVVSTAATYPLDLVNTRLKVQRSLATTTTTTGGDASASAAEDGPKKYTGVLDALRSVARTEGGITALYAGLGSDLAKSAADSFLFFLFYTWFRARRLLSSTRRSTRTGRKRLGAAEELAVAAAAGACARLLTMPVANVVARMQTAPLLVEGGITTTKNAGSGETLRRIWRERGVAGLWAGYSAALVLTLNPSITFVLDNALHGRLLDRGVGGRGHGYGQEDQEAAVGAGATFLLAAVSKAVATAVTYPFQTAKARLQVSLPASQPLPITAREGDGVLDKGKEKEEEQAAAEGEQVGISVAAGDGDGDGGGRSSVETAVRDVAVAVGGGVRSLAQDNIFATVAGIARAEGPRALYAGLSGELLKAFFGHGITMLSKDVAHRLFVWLYFLLAELWRRQRRGVAMVSSSAQHFGYSQVRAGGGGGGRQFGGPWGRAGQSAGRQLKTVTQDVVEVVVNMLDHSQRRVKDRW